MRTRLPEGKVPWERIADAVRTDLPGEVLLGPGHGEDAALVRIGGETWAVASDPVTFTSEDAGRLCVWINANDVAVRGATPSLFTAVVLVAPGDATGEAIARVLAGVRDACSSLGIALIGGHTEITPGLPRTLVVGTMLGRVRERAITTGGLREGDRIGMTGWAGLEGTSILLAEYGDRFRQVRGGRRIRTVESAAGDDWLLVVREAALAALIPGVSALHDVTEGGVGEALHELGSASKLGLRVDRTAIPVLPETAEICSDLGLDPLGLIGSGAMLVGCDRRDADLLEESFRREGIPFAWIGEAVAGDGGSNLPRFPRDEILRVGSMDGIEAVVFDMDGTLIDSHYDWKEIRESLKLSGDSIIDELNALPGVERTRRWEALCEIERQASRKAGLKKGARELLEYLRRTGIRTALVTNNSQENADFLLGRFELEFEVVLTRDSGMWKPSGAPVIEAIKRLGIPAGRCMKVGDSAYDLRAGREAGCSRVCILHGRAGALASECDLAFPDITRFFRYLEIVRPE
jgi:HAD superfamily hydrolase (TIGR01549 family)